MSIIWVGIEETKIMNTSQLRESLKEFLKLCLCIPELHLWRWFPHCSVIFEDAYRIQCKSPSAVSFSSTTAIPLFPGLPRFCSLVCVLYNTWKLKSGERQEGLGTPITYMTSGGCEVDIRGRGPPSNNILDFIIEHSNDSQNPRRS